MNPRPFLGDGCFQDSYLKPLSHLSVKWQTYLDLNEDRKSQNLSCFHYTIGLWLLSVVTIHAHLINSQGYSPEYERAKVVHRVRLELTESSLEERRTNHYANDAWQRR